MPAETAHLNPLRGAWSWLGGLSACVGLLWAFPTLWYTSRPADGAFKWFAEQDHLPGWSATNLPISKTAEAVLVGDKLVSAEFTRADGERVRVFSAKRYLKKENEIGLFSHTPDRCWTAVGWKIEPADPDCVEVEVHGVPMLFERRVYSFGAQRELVYFGALVGGRPLPYRLDQYHAAGATRTDIGAGDAHGTWHRIKQARVWSWAWDSFKNRTPLAGPQQFVRVSTPLSAIDTRTADQCLKDFLQHWLQPANYQAELAQWNAAGRPKVSREP